MTINSQINTVLTAKEVALICVSLGLFQDNGHDEKQTKEAKKLVDRLGMELYDTKTETK